MRKSAVRALPERLGLLAACLVLGLAAVGTAGGAQKEQYAGLIQASCDRHGVDPKLVHSIIAAESDYNPDAVSARGAVGLMQLMPETAFSYGVRNTFDPVENIEAGVHYLKDLFRTYQDDLDMILAAYNAGPEALKKYSGIPPYPETLRYIRKVKALFEGEGGRARTKIYRFRDSSGRLVLTNDKNFYLMNKGRTIGGSN
jgi:soluble lytic murein transglycosylase-like protein